MNATETGKLLALMAAYDNRTIGELDVMAWLEVIGDLPYADAETAVLGYYSRTRERIMPADVRELVREMRLERLRVTPLPDPPDGIGTDTATYVTWLDSERRKIMDAPVPLRALEGP